MKIKSNALYSYLQQTGALHGSPEALALAKREYRRLYKKQWKRKWKSKEMRITVTRQQFEAVVSMATAQHMKYTVYARSIILQAVGIHASPISKHQLQQVLQIIGMAITGITKQTLSMQQVAAQLQQTEAILIPYAVNH